MAFEVQTIDSDGYVDDSISEDTLESAVKTVARMASRNTDGYSKFKIFELVEVPFVIEQTDIAPTGRPPVVQEVNGFLVRTL